MDVEWAGKLGRTAINKASVAGRVDANANGLAGDERADKANHGGPCHAVHAYAREDYDWWRGFWDVTCVTAGSVRTSPRRGRTSMGRCSGDRIAERVLKDAP
ncbi:MOSC domain-containing protein [Nonomuraea sp. NPDC049129]|uniref:MOSC domain-containing protein n=1 Tax=Nonomuraea sp. NPDC049129 TaxID=3155272 RepID=UPI0033C17D0E